MNLGLIEECLNCEDLKDDLIEILGQETRILYCSSKNICPYRSKEHIQAVIKFISTEAT